MDRRVAKLEQSVTVVRGPDYRCAGSVQNQANLEPTCYAIVKCDKHGKCHSSTVCVEGNSWFGDSSDESGDDSWFGGGGLGRAKKSSAPVNAKASSKKVAAPSPPAPTPPAPASPPTTPPKKDRKDKEPRRTRKSATETLQQDVDTKAKI